MFCYLTSDFLLPLLDRQDSLHLFPVHSGPEELRVSTTGILCLVGISFLLSGLSQISGFWVHSEHQIGTEMPERGLLISANTENLNLTDLAKIIY